MKAKMKMEMEMEMEKNMGKNEVNEEVYDTTFLTEDTVGDLHTQKEEHSSLLLVSSCANSSDKKISAYISKSDSNSTTFTHQVKNMILECKNMKSVVSQKIDNFSQFYFFSQLIENRHC